MGERATFSPTAMANENPWNARTVVWNVARVGRFACSVLLEAKKSKIKETEEQFKVEQILNFIKNVKRIFRFDIFALVCHWSDWAGSRAHGERARETRDEGVVDATNSNR